MIIGCAVGALTGFFGAGGGFILTPVLNICLGLPMNIAVGTSACQITGSSAVALLGRLDRRLLGMRVALCLALGIPAGAWCGSILVNRFKNMQPWHIGGTAVSPVDFTLLSVFALLLFLLAVLMFFKSFGKDQEGTEVREGLLFRLRIPPTFRFRTIPAGKFSMPVMAVLGIMSGFLSGLLGIGGGVVLLPMLFFLVGQETKAATQTSLILVFLSGLFSTFFHAVDSNIDYPLAAALFFGGFFGARTGSRLHAVSSDAVIKKGFAFVVLGAWLLVVFKLWRILA